MTALLTDNLPLLAGAPNGIKKLRELILELAVRGKLVPQDPSDEPASELLKRIAEEKARLVAEGKIKRQKPRAHITEAEAPFDLPENWQWARLGDLSELITSGSRDWAQHYSDEGAIFVRMGNLSRGSYELRLNSIQRVSPPENGEGSRTKLEPGDLLLSITGDVGLLGLIPENFGEAYINQHVCLIRFISSIRGRFLPEALRSPLAYKQYEAPQRGIKNSFRLGDVSDILVPLPPLAEQHRIVAKVDELMALCDRLEAQQADAESAHAQLVQALLDSLTQASDATDFSANWQRLAEHFHTLFTTESSIDALKQTLLQLAVMGKLVPQDPSDEPASELLKRIAEEKARLVAEGKLKKQKPLPEITDDEKPFELPSGWEWLRLESLLKKIGAGSTPLGGKQGYVSEGIKFLRSQNVWNEGLRLDDVALIPESTHQKMSGTHVEAGDLLFNITGASIGRCAIVPDDFDTGNVSQHVTIVRPVISELRHFMHVILTSQLVQKTVMDVQVGVSREGLSIGKLSLFVIPCPPETEQHRIVAKVDQLMALCDQLKTRLTQARQLNEQLANTLVERALAGDHSQAPAAPDRKVARTLLAAEITHQLHSQRTFGQRKLQKVVYLAEHAARLAAIQSDNLRAAAGPHDRQLMNQVESELRNRQWYECIDRETVGHAYRPLSQAGQHRQEYESTWSVAERTTIKQVIELMRGWDTDRCEMTVTLYAAWNDLLLEGRPVSDEAILAEVMHSWNASKLRFSKAEWLETLNNMKQYALLTPSGFGRRTTGGMRALPGVE